MSTGGSRGSSPSDSTVPNDPWFVCIPPCEARIPCGQGRHTVRWEGGAILLPGHADPAAELVLAALGGDRAHCVEVAEAWRRHTADLTMLTIGTRGPADQVSISWADVEAAAQAGPKGPGSGWTGYAPLSGPRPRHGRMRVARPWPSRVSPELEEAWRRRNDLLSVLALGRGFQVRLIGEVAAAYADRLADGPDDSPEEDPGDGPEESSVRDDRGRRIRPTLTAALAGRLAPVVEEWLGLDPGQLVVSLHHGPGWGCVEWTWAELTGRGEQRRLRISLPAGWLARVWAAGLTLVRAPAGRCLVVAVDRGGWPDARVLALRAPGAAPVALDVHGRGGAQDGSDGPHWEV